MGYEGGGVRWGLECVRCAVGGGRREVGGGVWIGGGVLGGVRCEVRGVRCWRPCPLLEVEQLKVCGGRCVMGGVGCEGGRCVVWRMRGRGRG